MGRLTVTEQIDPKHQEELADGTITLEEIAEFVGLSIDEVKKSKAVQAI